MAKYDKGVATHDLLLKTAKTLFYEQGYEATTTRQIAEQSGINLGLIKYHFASKANMALEIYTELRQTFDGYIRSLQYSSEQNILIGSALEFVICFNSANFRRFYLEVYKEPQVQKLFQNKVHTIDGVAHDDVNNQLYGVAFSVMKPHLIAYSATEAGQKISQRDYILFYMTQQINAYQLAGSPAENARLASYCYEELQKYYFNVVNNFTPVITRISQ